MGLCQQKETASHEQDEADQQPKRVKKIPPVKCETV